MILLSELLNSYSPKHEMQQTLLLSTYSCGCQTTVTIARSASFSVSSVGLSEANGSLWKCSSSCSCGHDISFEEISNSDNIDATLLATEIKTFSSIDVSMKMKNVDIAA